VVEIVRPAGRDCKRKVSGQEQDHLPLCVDCLRLLREDTRAFWDGPAGQKFSFFFLSAWGGPVR
jgi:hypothetical protein